MCKFARCLFGTSSILMIVSALAVVVATATMITNISGWKDTENDG